MATPRNNERSHGLSAVIDAQEHQREADDRVGEKDDSPSREDTKRFRTPGFKRMRFDWKSDDKPIIERAIAAVEGRVYQNFQDAHQILNDLYLIVRNPIGVQDDVIEWEKDDYGNIVEDWRNLTIHQKEDFLFRITTRLVGWEQKAQDAWLEALIAKAQWEEAFGEGYEELEKGTVDDRNTRGKLEARDERYFAIYVTAYSRKAESLCKSMERIAQRLKDSLA